MKQKHLIRSIIPCIAAAFVVAVATGTPAQQFAPWKADVSVGDATLVKRDPDPHRSTTHRHRSATPIPSRPPTKGHRTVYSGPQGGAFFMIRFFQIVISPQDGPNCRYNPTCSAYGRQAVEMHGGLLGGFLAGDRLLRCNPYAPIGDDQVPRVLFGK